VVFFATSSYKMPEPFRRFKEYPYPFLPNYVGRSPRTYLETRVDGRIARNGGITGDGNEAATIKDESHCDTTQPVGGTSKDESHCDATQPVGGTSKDESHCDATQPVGGTSKDKSHCDAMQPVGGTSKDESHCDATQPVGGTSKDESPGIDFFSEGYLWSEDKTSSSMERYATNFEGFLITLDQGKQLY
jgi:hypothetical protein